MEPNIIVMSELNQNKHWAKEVLEVARKTNPNSFLFYKHEFIKKEHQIKSHVNSYTSNDMRSVFARKCKITAIETDVMRKFCNKYHIQGANTLAIIAFGIFEGDELLGVLSLGRHHRNNEDVLLDRMCFKNNVRVVGGASKLFNAAVVWAKAQGIDKIISFSDNRYSLGTVYDKLGFTLESELVPDYFYVERENIEKAYSKQSQKKQNVDCPEGMTERQWAEERGLVQVYDAGKKRWIYKLRKVVTNSFATRRHGFYETKKSRPKTIYYQSSYELRAATILDNDEDVDFYTTQVTASIDGRERIIDFLVTYKSGVVSIIEVKPRLKIEVCKQQIEDNKKIARENGWRFQLWTETELGFDSEYKAVCWADIFLSEIQGIDYVEERRDRHNESVKKHYKKHIATKTVEVPCVFCNEVHIALRLTYDKNIARNGRYICEREGGHIAGSNPKLSLRKDNPHSSDGKKECNKCKEVKLFEQFSPDKSKRDGYCTMCKPCRSEKMKANYAKKKEGS